MGPKRACCDLCQSVCLLYFPQEFYTALTPVRMFKLFGIILLYGVREHPHFVLLFIVSGSCTLSSTVAGPTFHRQRHWRTVPFLFFFFFVWAQAIPPSRRGKQSSGASTSNLGPTPSPASLEDSSLSSIPSPALTLCRDFDSGHSSTSHDDTSW